MSKIDTTIIVTELERRSITMDPEMQSRVAMNDAAIEDYRAAMVAGQTFPPCLVIDTGSEMLLCDGFHRFHAYERAGINSIPCLIKPGTRAEARWHAAAQNLTHGVRRTNEDKRRAVLMALQVKPDATLRDIATHCGVTHEMVRQVRLGLSASNIDDIQEAAQRLLKEVNQDPIAVASAVHAKASIAVNKAIEAMQRIMQTRHGAHIDNEAVQEAFARVMMALDNAAPARVCDECDGIGCPQCKGAGWVP